MRAVIWSMESGPGHSKKHDYVTGIHEVGSYPEEVEGDLAELIGEVNSVGPKAPLKAGAYLHARFENIHPFADGNGRRWADIIELLADDQRLSPHDHL